MQAVYEQKAERARAVAEEYASVNEQKQNADRDCQRIRSEIDSVKTETTTVQAAIKVLIDKRTAAQTVKHDIQTQLDSKAAIAKIAHAKYEKEAALIKSQIDVNPTPPSPPPPPPAIPIHSISRSCSCGLLWSVVVCCGLLWSVGSTLTLRCVDCN